MIKNAKMFGDDKTPMEDLTKLNTTSKEEIRLKTTPKSASKTSLTDTKHITQSRKSDSGRNVGLN